MKMRTTFTIAILATSMLGAGAAVAAPSDADYVKMAGAGDQYEIRSSKLLLTSTKNADLKTFANMMIKDHMNSTAMVKSAAMKAGMHPKPPMLDADGKDMMSKLKMAKGTDRDALYVSQQKMAHEKALALHQDEGSTGTTDSFKMAANNIVPVVQQHKSMLDGMPSM